MFILHSFFRAVPKELLEAALTDGAGTSPRFGASSFPISLPILAARLILDFVATWNESAMARVILQVASGTRKRDGR